MSLSPSARSPKYAAFSLRRVFAMVLRHSYLLRIVVAARARPDVLAGGADADVGLSADLRVAELRVRSCSAASTFIGAVMLWDVLFRGQLGFSISFLEEMYARNMGNLMMSPLRPIEFVLALTIQSVIRLSIGMVPVSFLAIWFFGFNLWGMGLALAVFFMNLLLTSWAIGIVVSGILLRHGLGAENLAWGFMFLMLPFTCVYYPVSVLPSWLQVVAWMLPPTYVFEGMRALLDRPRLPRRPDGAGFRLERGAVCRRAWRFSSSCSAARAARARCSRAATRRGAPATFGAWPGAIWKNPVKSVALCPITIG